MRTIAIPAALLTTGAFLCHAAEHTAAPLILEKRIEMPQVAIKGPGPKNFDALTASVETNRLFIAAQWHGSVEVYDLKGYKLIHSISGIGRPLDILYLNELNRIYVSDGTGAPTLGVGKSGALRIYNGKNYAQIRNVDLLPDADSIAYDAATKRIYVKNGGEDANRTDSFITILNSEGDKIGQITVPSDTVGDVVLEEDGSRLYVPDTDKHRKSKLIRVYDRKSGNLLASWPDPNGQHDGVMDLDQSNHLLFAGEPEGLVTVFDTRTGKELTTLPIGKGMDGLQFDEKTKRIYITCGDGNGEIDVYRQDDPAHYTLLGRVPSGPNARGGTLVAEENRFVTAVPERNGIPAQLLVYKVQRSPKE